MATDRIYTVANKITGDKRLIEAAGKTAALAYAVKTTLTAELASQSELVKLVTDGVLVEKADAPADGSAT